MLFVKFCVLFGSVTFVSAGYATSGSSEDDYEKIVQGLIVASRLVNYGFNVFANFAADASQAFSDGALVAADSKVLARNLVNYSPTHDDSHIDIDVAIRSVNYGIMFAINFAEHYFPPLKMMVDALRREAEVLQRIMLSGFGTVCRLVEGQYGGGYVAGNGGNCRHIFVPQ